MDMEENKEHKVVMRKMTKEEEQAKVEEQLKQEYLREQLRNAERERSARTKALYEKQNKKRLLASVINLVLLAIAIAVQVFVAMGAFNGVVGMFITGGLVVLSVIVLKVLTHQKKIKE